MRDNILDVMERMFERSTIGFNRLVPSVVHSSEITFPPVNVIKNGDDRYTIEMALAGYSKEDISISQGKNFITVEGKKNTEDEREYLVRGISGRSFRREIPVANGIEVKSAEMQNGILSVFLENKEAAAKQIPVM